MVPDSSCGSCDGWESPFHVTVGLVVEHSGSMPEKLKQVIAGATQTVTVAGKPPSTPDSVAGLIVRIEILRVGLEVIVVEGVNYRTLRRAAGHIPGTALSGGIGNVGISCHRDTFLRPLRDVRRDDLIIITTPAGDFRYRVVSTSDVEPTDVGVLDQGKGESLTLVTCYPFSFVGPSPERFIVRAERVL